MPLFERSFQDLVRDSLESVANQTRLTKMSQGGKARALLEAMDRGLARGYRTFDTNLARAFLSGATGRYLDLIGELLGVGRLGQDTARVTATYRTVRFFVQAGTFGDINGSSAILIPRGTRIFSEEGGTGIVWRVTAATTLPAASSSVFIAAEAISPGATGNVGQGVLRFHAFTDYTDSGNDSLKVENVESVSTGREIEDDTNYRFRISRQTLAAQTANETAVRLEALVTPGVADVIILKYFKGLGTYRLLIKAVTPTVPNSLINAVQAAIERVTALGTLAEAARPLESGLSFEVTVIYRERVPADEADAIEEDIRSTLTDYVNGLDIGEPFIINEAVERVMGTSAKIRDIGEPMRPFDHIFLYKETGLSDNKIKEELRSNYTPRTYERIIIEPSLAEPITILRA